MSTTDRSRQTTVPSRGPIPRTSSFSPQQITARLIFLVIGNAEPHDWHANNLGPYLGRCVRRPIITHLSPCSFARTRRPTISRRRVWTTLTLTATAVPIFTRVRSTGTGRYHLLTISLLTLSQPHKYATYGIVSSSAPSDDENESEDALPRSALNAPIEALQGLANAAVEAANAPELSPR